MDINALAAERLTASKYTLRVAPARRRFVPAAFTLAMAVGVVPLVVPMALWMKAALSVLTVWALTNVGGVTESRGWTVPSERARLTLVGAAAVGLALWTRQPWWLAAAAAAWAMGTWLTRTTKAG
ncbi:MAG: hypothetical protein Q8M65_01805 [Rhodoglobus sp.]|nr:hypothetical protein [Rhodoglobus sp.]